MADLEKVIIGLEHCRGIGDGHCYEDDCPYYQSGCEPELKDEALELLKAHEPGWISVKDRLPAETHSLFWPWRDSAKWNNAMWKEQSDKVIVAILFKDGTRTVRTGETHDGKWHTDVSRTLEQVVTHWMPLPEPPKEGGGEDMKGVKTDEK